MAFDNDDTDEWFSSNLKPLLRSIEGTSISVRRVDKIEHNDDIDDRIISEIEEADFVVADLTYARPSVYFEAGYAQRSIPVIYTCRSDHLRPSTDPGLAYLRVHFDLQMKNIVPWSTPRDATFIRRMASRVKHVLKPILREQAERQRRCDAAAEFARLSHRNQISAVDDAVRRLATSAGIRLDTERPSGFLSSGIIGRTLRDGGLIGFQSRIYEGIRKTDVEGALSRYLPYPAFDLQLPTYSCRVARLAQLDLMIALNKVPLGRVTGVLKSFSVVDLGQKHLRWVGSIPLPESRTAGYRHIYKTSSRYGDIHGFWGVRGDGTHDELEIHGDRLLGPRSSPPTRHDIRRRVETKRRDLGTILKVPHTVDVVIVDHVTSTLELQPRLKSVFERWQKLLESSRSDSTVAEDQVPA